MDQLERARRVERRRRLRLARNAAVGVALALAAVSIWLGRELPTGAPTADPSLPAASTAANATLELKEWRVELARLDACRNRLLSGRDGRALDGCYAPDSPAAAADRAALAELVTREVEFTRLPLRILNVEVMDKRWSAAGEFVRLLVEDELDANQVRVDGESISLPSRPRAEWEVTLWRQDRESQWQWYEVRPELPRKPGPASDAAS